MADKLSIWRGALRLLGQQRIASLTETGATTRALSDAWQPTGDYLLSKGLWNFAIRTVELSADEDVEPLIGYDYAFSKPTDWVRTANISADATFSEGLADYEDESGYWYANLDTIYVRYVSSDAQYGWNVGAWSEPFAKAFEAYLAMECGLTIANDKTNRNDLFTLFERRLKDAKTLDAVDERVRYQPAGRIVRARFAGRTSRRDG